MRLGVEGELGRGGRQIEDWAFGLTTRERQPKHFTYRDWLKLDELEVGLGRSKGRPRVKFTRVEDMHSALGRS